MLKVRKDTQITGPRSLDLANALPSAGLTGRDDASNSSSGSSSGSPRARLSLLTRHKLFSSKNTEDGRRQDPTQAPGRPRRAVQVAELYKGLVRSACEKPFLADSGRRLRDGEEVACVWLEGVVFPVKPVTGQVGVNTCCPRTPVSNWTSGASQALGFWRGRDAASCGITTEGAGATLSKS